MNNMWVTDPESDMGMMLHIHMHEEMNISTEGDTNTANTDSGDDT
jgi:hypothetical protein